MVSHTMDLDTRHHLGHFLKSSQAVTDLASYLIVISMSTMSSYLSLASCTIWRTLVFGPKLFFLPPSPSLPIILSFIFHGIIVSSLRLPVPISFCQLNKVGCLASLTKKSMSKKLVGCGALCVCVCVCVCNTRYASSTILSITILTMTLETSVFT